ncbi:serine/threonine-protein kinase SBK1 isoform X1 [Lingula anatina]|uniref:Serine/threonine-protein kinase SBK1 isoform X1 n=2 Tax=Lingula anatina TaxID=7574 RepID=A0A1S3HEE6_LINAN|nr:serine/threonine-protein kinase SBK1 isoform X1 [Lingula anatina]|eukprot:XP_013384380.1 serine/threonine-protein kinase SBK1 isoform X1 [Lingula anatina]
MYSKFSHSRVDDCCENNLFKKKKRVNDQIPMPTARSQNDHIEKCKGFIHRSKQRLFYHNNMDPPKDPSSSPRSSVSDSLPLINLSEHYDIVKTLGSGTYGNVMLARCKTTDTVVALKNLLKKGTKFRDFQREFTYGYFLSPHCAIVNTFDVAFETETSYMFALEHAPLGDLFETIPPQIGLDEKRGKCIIKQVASALDFMHSKHLVHRDIKPENVLLFDRECTKVKLMDFGMTRKRGTLVRKISGSIPYTPPEICEAVKNEGFYVEKSADVWGCAVLLFTILTGNFPWENADVGDPYFVEFAQWQKRKIGPTPSQWRRFTPRLMRLFRKMLDTKPEKRCEITAVYRYIGDAWLKKAKTSYDCDDDISSDDSKGTEMIELRHALEKHGIDTKVSKKLKEKRINEWIMSLGLE